MKYRRAAAVTLSLIGGTLLSGTAAAAWVQWATNPQSKIAFYYDPASIKKTGNVARMSILFDFEKPEKERGKLYSSLVEQGDYDCRSTRRRVIQATWHPQRMGKGKGTASLDKPGPWVESSEDTEKRAWKLACGK
jgi:hypothetical protein